MGNDTQTAVESFASTTIVYKRCAASQKQHEQERLRTRSDNYSL